MAFCLLGLKYRNVLYGVLFISGFMVWLCLFYCLYYLFIGFKFPLITVYEKRYFCLSESLWFSIVFFDRCASSSPIWFYYLYLFLQLSCLCLLRFIYGMCNRIYSLVNKRPRVILYRIPRITKFIVFAYMVILIF